MKKVIYLLSVLLSLNAASQSNTIGGSSPTIPQYLYGTPIYVPNLTTTWGDSSWKLGAYNPSTKEWRYTTYIGALYGGGSSTPAHGNFGNVQLNRNLQFKGTDSLSYDGGALNITGALKQTGGAYGFSDFGAGHIWRSSTYGLIIYPSAGSSTLFILRDASGNSIMNTPAGTTNVLFGGDIAINNTEYLYFDGISGDRIGQPSSDVINIDVNSSTKLQATGTGVNVTGVLKVNDGAAAAGYVFTSTDANGTGSWQPFPSNAGNNDTYTPTLTNTTNVAASTASVTGWYRVGDRVTVYGQVAIDPTSTGAVELRMSLPMTTAGFAGTYQAGGTAACAATNEAVAISAVVTNSLVAFKYTATSTANNTFSFQFSFTWLAP